MISNIARVPLIVCSLFLTVLILLFRTHSADARLVSIVQYDGDDSGIMQSRTYREGGGVLLPDILRCINVIMTASKSVGGCERPPILWQKSNKYISYIYLLPIQSDRNDSHIFVRNIAFALYAVVTGSHLVNYHISFLVNTPPPRTVVIKVRSQPKYPSCLLSKLYDAVESTLVI